MRPLAITILAMLAAACGSSGGSPTTTGNAASNPATAAYKFAACMRDHGVSNFPDPQVTTGPSPGQASIRQVLPASAGASPHLKAAQKACQGIIGAPRNIRSRDRGPGKQALLAFARCLRSHGVSDFPDPNGQGQLTLEMISAAGVDLHAPSVLTAAKACVGVTHGAITLAAVARAINGPH